MSKTIRILVFIVAWICFSCNSETKNHKEVKDLGAKTMYFNGDIITMEGMEESYEETVIEQKGKIIFLGTKEEALKKHKDAIPHDLKGKTLLPGLIEPHLHPSLAAIMLQNEVIAPYDWNIPTGLKKGAQTAEEYIKRLKETITKNAKEDELFFVWGYHQLWHGQLDRSMLNELAGNKPVAIIHRSFHEIFLNDAAIQYTGIKEDDFKDNPQVFWDKGHFYEGGFLALAPILSQWFLAPESYLKGLSSMSKLMLKNGITTIAEPGFPSVDFNIELDLLQKEMDKNPAYSVYLIPNHTQLYGMKGGNENAKNFIESLDTIKTSSNIRFLPKQVKLFSDGAIYSQLMQMKDGYTDGHHGEWMTPLDLFEIQLSMYWNNDYKIHVHANGDLGQQMVIDLVKKMQASHPREDHRLTLHHMGYFDEPMAQQMSSLGIEASVNPYYLWALADKYAEFGLGPNRAENLVALKLLTDHNIPLSFHSDFSMAPAEPLNLAWTAINRVTSQGSKFSQNQRLSVFNAMKAITIDAARTLNLEDELGSLKMGKTANFTILENNPFKINSMAIKDIKVEGVVYQGDFIVNNL